MRICLLMGLMLCAGMTLAVAAPLAGQFSDELRSDRYDCVLVLHPEAQLSAHSAVTLTLEAGEGGDALRLRLTRQDLALQATVNGQVTRLAPVASGVQPGMDYQLTVLRRGAWLGLLHAQRLLFRGQVPRAKGALGGCVAGPGWTVAEPRVRHPEPVAFADNFMRTADEPGSWSVRRGTWRLQSAWDTDPKGNYHRFENAMYGQNPFAWAGRSSTAGTSALCTAGKAFWEDYTFTTAVQPGTGGAAGVMVNMPDAAHGYLVRMSPANDHSAGGDRLSLFRVDGETRTLITEDRGGYVPGQWIKLTVISTLSGLQVLVDGRRRLSTRAVSPWRGGVGLYTEGPNGAVFNNVTVYGSTLHADLLREQQQEHIQQRFLDDTNGMEDWAVRKDWDIFPGQPDQLLYRNELYGDQWMTLTVRPFTSKTGELMLGLNSDGKDPASGYRVVLAQADGKLTMTLYCGATVLREKTGTPLDTSAEYTFRFRHTGKTLRLERDGEAVLEAAETQPLTTGAASYCALGSFALAHDVAVFGDNMLNYSFAESPVDWREQGTWMQTTRWSCSPQWSFLTGWSRGDAMLSYKKRLVGDQAFEAFVGTKMEYPRQPDVYDNRFRDFAISICSDGHNPRSGYAGIYGAPDTTGAVLNQRTVLLRNGVEVAEVPLRVPDKGAGFRMWFDLELRKKGAVIEFWVGGERVLSYTDPHPLDGGVPAIWTTNNAITVAFAQLRYAHPAVLRNETQVILANPWIPEWMNVNVPLKLDFAGTWATNGEPVVFQVKEHLAPAGDAGAVTVQGQEIICTPKKPGDRWYEISASDGAVPSPSFHLFGPTFTPALRRNDAHAVVLYRFNEGKGSIVHDQSKIGPPADLLIRKNQGTDKAPHWLPEQGLTIRSTSLLRSTGSVPKLMALAKVKAGTLEFWVSPDTCYPATGSGCLLAWKVGGKSNFDVVHQYDALSFKNQQSLTCAFGIGLHHYVVTWDGATTCCYGDGKLTSTDKVDWGSDHWLRDGALLLGNDEQLGCNFLGTYYLVAIHDRCLPAAEVLHNYLAGPSAR